MEGIKQKHEEILQQYPKGLVALYKKIVEDQGAHLTADERQVNIKRYIAEVVSKNGN